MGTHQVSSPSAGIPGLMQQTYLLKENQTLSLNAALSGLWHHGLTGSSPRLLQSAKSSRRPSNLGSFFYFPWLPTKKLSKRVKA
jgi:hypothetical protein